MIKASDVIYIQLLVHVDMTEVTSESGKLKVTLSILSLGIRGICWHWICDLLAKIIQSQHSSSKCENN